MDEKKKSTKKHFNIPKETAIKINEIRDHIVMLQTARKGNIESYSEKIEQLSKQKWFLEVTENAGKDDIEFKDLHGELSEETEKGLTYYNAMIKDEEEDLEVVDTFLEMFDSRVEIETDDKGEVHYNYDLNFFNIILSFAQVTNLGGLF